eukprot:3869316-Pyramimonas_sp.AAC.1
MGAWKTKLDPDPATEHEAHVPKRTQNSTPTACISSVPPLRTTSGTPSRPFFAGGGGRDRYQRAHCDLPACFRV